MGLQTSNIIYSCDDIGSSTSNYYTVLYGTAVQSNSVAAVNAPVIKYESVNISLTQNKPVSLSGGLFVTPEYWVDATLGSGAYTDEFIKLSDGIPIVLSIYDCSGIYSTSPFEFWTGTGGMGVKVDDILTPNMRFERGGDSKAYRDAAAWGGGYWATGENVNVTLTHSGVNILHVTSQTIRSVIWHYNLTGFFNLYLNLKLDLTNARTEYPFTHPDFYMSGCILSFDMLDKNGASALKKSYSGVVIDPPNAVGSISVTSNLNKTISDVTFRMSRDAVRGSVTYTEMHNVIKNVYNFSTGTVQTSTPWNYKNDNVASDTYVVPISSFDRGGYCSMQYEPKLAGIKPGVVGGIAYTNYVTNCTGHKFSIANATLKMSVSGIFTTDVIDTISNQSPYVFIDPVNTSGHIKVTFNANHEDWTTGTPRDSTPASGIYPFLTGVYIIASLSPTILNGLTPYTYTPYDDVTTYPNVDITKATLDRLLVLPDTYTNYIALTPNTYTSLTAQAITVNVLKSGRYKVFIGVADQYNQISFWCITNKNNDYNIPF